MDFAQWYLLFYTALGFLNLGLIWVVQLVVYPLFDVRADAYSDYHVSHGSRIPLPVIVPGFALMLSILALPFFRPDTVPLPLVIALVACALVAMYVTFAMEIPRHKRLEKGKSEEAIWELIRYNWPRRLSQACAALLALWMLAAAFAPA
jgi:hypothetical protein